MEQLFLDKYFPPSKTAELRNQITNFSQREDESLFEAWDRFKGMLQMCPHHGLEQWLIVHTFYNGLAYSTKLSLDAAAGGALMNKNITEAYNLIESIALNHHQWADEGRKSKKASGKYDVNALDLIAAKVEALTQKLDKVNLVGSVNAFNVSCEICGSQEHTIADCQLGMSPSQVASMEQVNAVGNFGQRMQGDPFSSRYNSGWRNHPNFSYKNNQNQTGQGSNRPPPGFSQQQGQKSNLETLMENFVLSQTKQNEIYSQQGQDMREAIRQLTSRVDSLTTHSKMLETQIAQQASSSSTRAPGMFPSQPETNPSDHCMAVTLRSGRQLEGPKEDTEQAKLPHKEDKKEEAQKEEAQEEEGSNSAPPKPYQPPVPFPQRLARTKLDNQFKKFLEVLKQLHVNIPFTDILQQMPAYAKFLKEILSNKRKLEENATVALTEECSALIQEELPPKLKDPGSFSIPCLIGNLQIDKALCDLGASVNLMPLSAYEKLKIGELKPTTVSLQLADQSVKYPVGILEDVPIKVGKFYIPADFVVLEIKEDSPISIILGRPFLATAGAVIDMKSGKLSFSVGDDKIEFNFPNPTNQSSVKNVCYRINVQDYTEDPPMDGDLFKDCRAVDKGPSPTKQALNKETIDEGGRSFTEDSQNAIVFQNNNSTGKVVTYALPFDSG